LGIMYTRPLKPWIRQSEVHISLHGRYALKDLWESEREYVDDLSSVMDTYFKAFDGQLPEELSGKRDVIFNTFPDIFRFHNE